MFRTSFVAFGTLYGSIRDPDSVVVAFGTLFDGGTRLVSQKLKDSQTSLAAGDQGFYVYKNKTLPLIIGSSDTV